jgi:hypothetical protein
MDLVATIKEEEKKYNGDPLETEEEIFFAWEAPGRIFRERNKEFYSTILILALLLSVIMFLIEGVMPVFLIWSVVFLVWVMSKTKPVMVTHKLTSWGIRSDEQLFQWDEMETFWVEEKKGEVVLRVLLFRRFPGQLVLILTRGNEEKVAGIMKRFVKLEKPAPTWSDKTAKWLSEKVPLSEG